MKDSPRPVAPIVDPMDEAGIGYLCYLVELLVWKLRTWLLTIRGEKCDERHV